VLNLDTSGLSLAYNSARVLGASQIAASGSTAFNIARSASGSVLSDYSFSGPTIASASASITPRALTVAANSASKAFDGVPHSGGSGVSYSGFAPADDPGVLTGTLAYAGDSQGATAVGRYAISPSGYISSDYAIQFTDGTLLIAPAPTPKPSITPTIPALPLVSNMPTLPGAAGLADGRAGAQPVIYPRAELVPSPLLGGAAPVDAATGVRTLASLRPATGLQSVASQRASETIFVGSVDECPAASPAAIGEADGRAQQLQPSTSIRIQGCRYRVLPRITPAMPEPGLLSYVGFTLLRGDASPVANASFEVIYRTGTLGLTPTELPSPHRLTAPGTVLAHYSFSMLSPQGIEVSINAQLAESGLVIQSSGIDAAALVSTESQLIAAAAILEAARQGLMLPAKVRAIYFDEKR
jgi:MBG domain (YGX type)